MEIRKKSFGFCLEVEDKVLWYLTERVVVIQDRRTSLLGREPDFRLIEP